MPKSFQLLSVLPVLALLLLDASSLQSADAACGVFEGTWTLDRGRSSALPPGMEQTMTVVAEGMGIHVKTAIVTDFADRVQEDQYVFDGAEYDVTTPGAGSGKRSAKREGARSFRANDRLKGPNGEVAIERVWSVSEDGSEISIDLTSNGFTGRTQTHRVFTRGEGAVAPAPAESSRIFPVDLTVPLPPSPFRQHGRTQLVYELALRSFRGGEIEWKALDVLDETGRVLGSYEDDALAGILARPGAQPGLEQPRRIAAGMNAVAYLWLSVEGETPKSLRHRATFTIPSASSGARRVIHSDAIAVGPPAPLLGPPATGRGWVARWISNSSFHRRGLAPVDGRASIAQRFAIDWNRYDEQGVEQKGDASDNATYSVYGQQVIAVADATVVKVSDGVAQNRPPNIAPGLGFDPEKALGNGVVLELPGHLFATYAHMQPGSIKVKVGERVRRGQLLGLVGNSGNATGPHLHFHVATGPGLSGEGVPYVIESFERLGAENVDGDAPVWNPKSAGATSARGEMPAEHDVVAFR